MPRSILSSKGQIVLPKGLRDALGWTQGTELPIEMSDNSLTVQKAAKEHRLPSVADVRRVANMLKSNGPRRSLEDMDAALEDMFRNDHGARRDRI